MWEPGRLGICFLSFRAVDNKARHYINNFPNTAGVVVSLVSPPPHPSLPPSPKSDVENSQNTVGVNLFCFGGSGDPPGERRAAIMPQCFQWNVTAIVDQDDSHWEDSPSLPPNPSSPPHPFHCQHNTMCCIIPMRHATVFIASDPVTASRGQDNEKDDTEVIG